MDDLTNWTLSLTPGFAALTFIFCVLASLVGLVFGFYFLRHRRIFEDTPTSKIRSASQGFVEIEGVAKELDEPLRSPGKKKECVWYAFWIERKMGKDNKWQVVHKETSPFSFYVDDGTGICAVDPEAARLITKKKQTWISGELRYSEKSINVGDKLYCIGQFETEMGPSRAKVIKESARILLNEWKSDRAALLATFDTNNDGEIDMAEWEQARAKAKNQVRAEVADDYAPTQHHLLVKPFSKKHPFIISCFSEEQLTGKYRWYSLGALATFFITGGYSVFLVAVRGGWFI